MKKIIAIVFLVASATAYASTIEHSGGTDAMGCHTDRKTGIWHCH